jgi:hypothetical protein
MLRVATAVMVFACTLGLAQAADLSRPSFDRITAPEPVASWRLADELRGGVFAHDPSSQEGGSVDVNLELLSARLPLGDPTTLLGMLVPRLHVGTDINTAGKTSEFYAGLTWTFDVTRWLFVEGSFGGALHTGFTGPVPPPGRNALGCNPLFRESGTIGVRLSENWSVMATIDHISNADLCTRNRGLTNFGGRIGYRF